MIEGECGPRAETEGPWQCAACGASYHRSLRHRCAGAPPPAPNPPIGPCPIIGAPCDELRINRLNYFCGMDLAAIDEPCGDAKQAKAVVILVQRAAGQALPCPRQEKR